MKYLDLAVALAVGVGIGLLVAVLSRRPGPEPSNDKG